MAGEDHSEVHAYEVASDTLSSEPDAKAYKSQGVIATIPSKTAANFRYNEDTGNLVFSAYVYPDGNLSTVAEQDKKWEERGNTALVYDGTYERHWDTWSGKKGPQLFSVKLSKSADGKWLAQDDFKSPLQGTRHVRSSSVYSMVDFLLTSPLVHPR